MGLRHASMDATAHLAAQVGAHVRHVLAKGKGNVVRAMFRDVDADIYVMVDGDDTYPAASVRMLIEDVAQGRADMVVGTRLESHDRASFRRFHGFGNRLVCRCIGACSAIRCAMSCPAIALSPADSSSPCRCFPVGSRSRQK